jgi:hypothetical protein
MKVKPIGELRLNHIPDTETLSVRVWQCQTPTTGDTIFEPLPKPLDIAERFFPCDIPPPVKV